MPPLIESNRLAFIVLNAAYIIWLLPEVIYSTTRRLATAAKINDRRSGAVLVACIWIGIFLGYLFAQVNSFAISWQPFIVFAFGILVMLAGVAFRWYAVHVLGKYFTLSLGIQPGQTVIEAGPYRLIRHPSYTGALITMFGLGLAFTNWLSLIGIVLPGLIGYSYRVGVEEQILVAALGDPYLTYMEHTKRFIPFVY